jgi:hypothetical protein
MEAGALKILGSAIADFRFADTNFDVCKVNERVWQFHERFGPQRVAETEPDFFYRLDRETIAASREHYGRFLGGTVSVVFP